MLFLCGELRTASAGGAGSITAGRDLLTSSSPARVHVVLADAAPEEALAAVTAGRPVVFARGSVPTDGTQAARPHVACGVHVGALNW